MGEAQKLPDAELLARRARGSKPARIDGRGRGGVRPARPETLSLVNRFEEVKAAAPDAGRRAPRRRADRERGRGAHRPLRELRGGISADGRAARAAGRLAEGLGISLGATGTHPWSRWQDQRIIDTPHYRRNDELLRYVVWRNNTFGLHVHVGIRGADRAVAVHDGLRVFLPHLLALSVSSPLVEGVNSGLHSARTQIFTRMFPRCGVPDPYRTWDVFEEYVKTLYETGSIDEHTQLWWSVRPHLAYPTVEIRICDGQPDLAESRALAGFCYSLAARIARAVDEGERLPLPPPRMIEENFWRASAMGCPERFSIRGRHEVRAARAELERARGVDGPVADELGCCVLTVPATTAAERQIARVEEGWSLEEIYAEQVPTGQVVRG